MAEHTQDCRIQTERAARIVSSVHGYVTKAEADRYTTAIDNCPAEHPWA